MAFLILASSAMTLGHIVVNGLVLGSIPPAVRNGLDSNEGRRLLALLVASGSISLVGLLVSTIRAAAASIHRMKLSSLVQRKPMVAALGPAGIAHMEDPKFIDEVAAAQGQGQGMFGMEQIQVPQTLGQLAETSLQVLGALVMLAHFEWWAAAVLLAVILLANRWFNRELDRGFGAFIQQTEENRRSSYYRNLALEPLAAKEVRVFGLDSWIVARFLRYGRRALEEVWEIRSRLNTEMIVASLAMGIGYLFVYLSIGRAGIRNEITLAQIGIYAQAGIILMNVLMEGGPKLGLRGAANTVPYLLGLESRARRPETILDGSLIDTKGLPKSGIEFQDVSFAYPGTETKVFDGLQLQIPAGMSIAIVGANGAGKTTLVKLLASLYDPQGGQIAVDGIDLRQLSPEAWRSRLAVIFQDFVRYPLPARDNVGFGSLELAEDQSVLERAAARAGADGIIDSLSNGWQTILSREFEGGAELSGGQWQRIALARALMAAEKGGVLVLDEPTASLDVRAEAELFERFIELTRGVTTILISHRFSSVRHADRICVLDRGRLVEEGTHQELKERGGHYARMFNLQASRFEERADA